jgi:hypothetical protein
VSCVVQWCGVQALCRNRLSQVRDGFLISDERQMIEGLVEPEILNVEKGRREGQTSPS